MFQVWFVFWKWERDLIKVSCQVVCVCPCAWVDWFGTGIVLRCKCFDRLNWKWMCLWSKSHYCQWFVRYDAQKIVANQHVMSVCWTIIESIRKRKTESSQSPLQLFATLLAHLEAKTRTDRQTEKKDHTEDRLSNYYILASESPTYCNCIHTHYVLYMYIYIIYTKYTCILHDMGPSNESNESMKSRSKVIYLLPSLPHLW